MDDNIIINATEILEKQEKTLQVAIAIQQLLTNLNNAYNNGLQEIKDLGDKIKVDITNFYENAQQVMDKVAEVKAEVDEAIKQIGEIKPQIQDIIDLANQTEASLTRLEEINQNVINIEQSIMEAIKGLDLEHIKELAQQVVGEVVEEAGNGISAIKESAIYQMTEEARKLEGLVKYAFNEIERLKQEALDEIAQAGGVGWYRVLQECITTKNHALATLASKRVDKDKFDRIGSVINLAARKREIPLGYVKPNTPLSIIDYAMLYHLSGSTSTDGKTFSINLPSASATDYIYSGKEK